MILRKSSNFFLDRNHTTNLTLRTNTEWYINYVSQQKENFHFEERM